jgi:hypothetical protein
MPWIDSLDYLNLNSLRRYPLREGSLVRSEDGLFTLPDSFIVEFSLSATNDISRRFYLSKIFNRGTSALLEIADFSGLVVGVFDVNFVTHSTNDTYYMEGTGDYAGARGRVTIGTVEDFQRQPVGTFSFATTSTEFEPKTIIPAVAGVTRIKYIDAGGRNRTLYGDVVMNARSNMRFSFDSVIQKVTMDVGDNLGLNKLCDTGNCIKRINGVTPDPTSGNLTLIGLDCLKVSSSAAYTLELQDSCCTPCSGCSDLSELTTRLTSLENKFIELKGYYTMINGQLVNYLTTVNSNCSCP